MDAVIVKGHVMGAWVLSSVIDWVGGWVDLTDGLDTLWRRLGGSDRRSGHFV
jgi:hypothetical protein